MSYQYDGFDELTQEISQATTGTTAISYNSAFAYDLSGNPTTSNRLIGSNFNADNQNTTVLLSDGTSKALSYNGNGNPSMLPREMGSSYADGLFTALYDPENRLTSSDDDDLRMIYDGDGLRTFDNIGSQGEPSYHLFDGSTSVVEAGNNSYAELAFNLYGADGLAGRMTSGAGYLAELYDPQGNAVQTVHFYYNGTTTAPQVANTKVYDAFGERGGYANDDYEGTYTYTYNPVGFGGQFGYYKEPYGHYLLGHRFYDPGMGRFVTRDPIGYKGGINLYGFAGNNPVNESDPSGYSRAGDVAGVVGLVPGPVGEAANLASGLDSLHDGDYLGAALSLGGEVPGLGEIATGAKILRAVNRLRKAERVAKDAEEAAKGADEIIRLRHYTTTSGSRGIEKDGIIIAKDQNKVFTESARHKALSPTDAERKYLLKRGHGNAHVEFNARRSEVEVRHNPLSGATEHVLNGDVRLEGRNPVFTRR